MWGRHLRVQLANTCTVQAATHRTTVNSCKDACCAVCAVFFVMCRKRKEEAAKKKEQKKILGKGRAKLSFSFG